ncbi:hypothetical protein JCM17960_08290 [Magnetospira thiophila]
MYAKWIGWFPLERFGKLPQRNKAVADGPQVVSFDWGRSIERTRFAPSRRAECRITTQFAGQEILCDTQWAARYAECTLVGIKFGIRLDIVPAVGVRLRGFMGVCSQDPRCPKSNNDCDNSNYVSHVWSIGHYCALQKAKLCRD